MLSECGTVENDLPEGCIHHLAVDIRTGEDLARAASLEAAVGVCVVALADFFTVGDHRITGRDDPLFAIHNADLEIPRFAWAHGASRIVGCERVKVASERHRAAKEGVNVGTQHIEHLLISDGDIRLHSLDAVISTNLHGCVKIATQRCAP